MDFRQCNDILIMLFLLYQTKEVIIMNKKPGKSINGEKHLIKETERKSKHSKHIIELILNSSEGSFICFSMSLSLGYIVHSLSKNGYNGKIITKAGTEYSISKGEDNNE